ncbi:signal peptidase II [uncultured Fretibacterium sp.]|uniref:signal peptidase II n=1 Tax=uncultured Fretibacterium sp. TaxID=1678694 RepID=UPI00325FDE3D
MRRGRHDGGGYGTLRLMTMALSADLAVKGAARFLLSGKTVPLVLGFRLELHLNSGVSFGLTPTLGWAVGLLGLAVLLGLTWASRGRTGRAGCGLALLWAGGLSNALERLFLGSVTDFFLVPLQRIPWVPLSGLYLNLADLWLFLGAVLLLLDFLSHTKGGGGEPSAADKP